MRFNSKKVSDYIRAGNRIVATIRRNKRYLNGRVRNVRLVLDNGEVYFGVIKDILPLSRANEVVKFSGFSSVNEWFSEAKRLHKVKKLDDRFAILLIELKELSGKLAIVSFDLDKKTKEILDSFENRSAVVKEAIKLMLATDINKVREVYRNLPRDRDIKVSIRIPDVMLKELDEFVTRNGMERSSAIHTALMLFLREQGKL